jgi:hypothetical protein
MPTHSPGVVMILQQWRARLTFAGLSVFLAWHTIAMLIAPAPNVSGAVKALRVAYQPYLSLFRLDNAWDFFAPDVGTGSLLRYIVEDPRGKHYVFTPTKDLDPFHPSFYWFRFSYYAVINVPETYADPAGAILCTKHSSLHPVSVILVQVEEGDFTPKDRLDGKHPMDPEFVTSSTLKKVECPRS